MSLLYRIKTRRSCFYPYK
uniref:Uncharacterized protein n=1 Tax=Arundo donax TaxID=35708 RepID=A0A0A9G7E5_ARUDO